jgi:hypothetical protein
VSDSLGGIVLAAIEEVVDEVLNTPPQGIEQCRYKESGCHDRQVASLPVSVDGNRKSPRREARIAERFLYDAQETCITPSRYGRESPAT